MELGNMGRVGKTHPTCPRKVYSEPPGLNHFRLMTPRAPLLLDELDVTLVTAINIREPQGWAEKSVPSTEGQDRDGWGKGYGHIHRPLPGGPERNWTWMALENAEGLGRKPPPGAMALWH